MCKFFGVSRSGYYAFVHRLGRPEQDAALAEVIAEQRERSFRTYGYRRMWLWLKKQDIFCNPKTVLRIMKKYDLLSEIRRRRKWQQMGQQAHKYKNLLNMDFHASKPNSKWVTDISYIHTRQGVLYLSMIRDLYDNSIVAYKTGTEQTVNLVLDTIRLAMKQEKEKVAVELQLHSDQGAQYASQAYFELTQTYGITPSMSRRGNPYDNAMAENFFSILKTECIYRHKPARGRLLIRLLTIAADDAAIPQIFQKDNQKFRQTLARNADQCDQSRRKGGQAQNDNAGRQPERNKHEDRHPDGKSQDTGLNNIPRTEHTAEKCA